jgi:hypothetical protein
MQEWEQMYETERREHAETQSQVEGVQEREKRAKSKVSSRHSHNITR